MSKFSVPGRAKKAAVLYSGLSGVDLSGEGRGISGRRASYSQNMYKKYTDGFASFVETRPGIRRLLSLGEAIYGIHFLKTGALTKAVVHAGDKLYGWQPTQGEPTEIYPAAAAATSVSFCFGDRLYILDGVNYLEFDGAACANVTPTVPVTSIARAPLGGGTMYQSVNMLTSRRKNSFRGDGQSLEYHLDATGLNDEDLEITVDGMGVFDFTVDRVAGIVTFSAPPAKAPGGNDNVIIEFGRTIPAHAAVVAGCRVACLFDNRVFLAGNDDHKNILWHSEVNDPCYFGDQNYYKDGPPDSPIVGLAVRDNTLIAVKASSGNRSAVYRHTPATDYELGRVYPAEESSISLGCAAVGALTSFRDDLVYLSDLGLEGLDFSGSSLHHRSTLIDGRLLNKSLSAARLQEWGGYLCLLVGAEMYLADARGRFGDGDAHEYEWFLWTGIGAAHNGDFSPATVLREHEGQLFFGAPNGAVCLFYGTDDDSAPIESVWVTKNETAGSYSARKSVGKKGAFVLLKTIPNSRVNIAAIADGGPERPITSVNMGGLDFGNLDFVALSFSTDEDNVVELPLTEKCFKSLKLKLYSDRSFGVGALAYHAAIVDYIE